MRTKNILKRFHKKSSSKIFREATSLDKFREYIPIAKYPDSWITVHYKGYPKFEKIKLPEAPELPMNFGVFKYRQSYRTYSGESLELKELSLLLYYAAGIKDPKANDIGNRFYPSAGGRYPIELYPVIFNVEGVKPGIYHYHVRSHSLEYMWTPKGFPECMIDKFEQEGMVRKASILLLFTGCFARTEMKYGARGYRHVMIETGAIQQNIYLTCSYADIGCCSIGGYLDKTMNKFLDVDGLTESIVLAMTIGKKR